MTSKCCLWYLHYFSVEIIPAFNFNTYGQFRRGNLTIGEIILVRTIVFIRAFIFAS